MASAAAAARAGGVASCSYAVPVGARRRPACESPPARHFCAPGGSGRPHSAPTIEARRGVIAHSQRDDESASSGGAALGARSLLMLGGAGLALLAACHPALAEPAGQGPSFHPVAAELHDLAQNEDFWENLLRYARFFTSVLVGTAYTALKPVGGLLRRPVTAVLVIAFVACGYVLLNATLKSMLGVEVQEPLPLF